ncbi:MAG TPA: MarP family serine protease [Nocardioidaceae bacterium]|nr:MarP family serine protease [Nocardioidaceae bacterium]
MNFLDLMLILLVLAYAVSGYWQGFISGAFATVGLLTGGVAGIWLAPQLLGDADPSLWVSLSALFIVLLCASLGQAVLQYAGGRIRDQIKWQPVRSLDAVGGAALSVVAVLVVAWALGVALSGARVPWVSKTVNSSAVLQRVNDVMPNDAVQALHSFNDVVGASFFPRYLEPFARERITAVGPPPAKIAKNQNVVSAGRSVLKIRGENSCGRGVEGSGFLYQPNRIMTNAHVVAGVDRPNVVVDGQELEARVVVYDEDLDIAVLAIEGLGLPYLPFDFDAESGESAAVLGYPEDGPYDVQGARIRAVQRLRSPDIYGRGTVVREVYSLRSNIRPGNSGGPLVSTSGEVLGMIFAASVTDKETGYALTSDQLRDSAGIGSSSTAEADTGACS